MKYFQKLDFEAFPQNSNQNHDNKNEKLVFRIE